ncbi:MAG: lysylphosphatidylglycerol synthase transmembrane domain-containing protein [Candidatus Dormibacteria bacterium]|jgi:uncharacterized membrane protein YbhN (UPF0104 family)
MSRAHRVRLIIQTAVTVGILVALIIILRPGDLLGDLGRFPPILIPALVGLTACFYLSKALRWHQLLRSESVPVTPRDSVLFTVSGEAFGLLPFGELARAELATEATGAPLGATMATVTVQELLYTLVIVGVSVPGSLAYTAGISGIAVALASIVVILVILTVNPIFHAMLKLVGIIPGVRRASTQLEVLHEQTVQLLRRPGTWLWIILSVLSALLEVTLFWLVVRGVINQPISWGATTFIYGAAYLSGAVTSPGGGVGGFESTVIALLTAKGVPGDAAVAAALLMRASDKGLITVTGLFTWFWVRRRLAKRRGLLLGGVVEVPDPQAAPLPVADAASAITPGRPFDAPLPDRAAGGPSPGEAQTGGASAGAADTA